MTEKNDLWGLAFGQLVATDDEALATARPNPSPAGMVRRGSSTQFVWDFLNECRGRFFRAQDIQRATGLSRAAVSWALYYLHCQGLVKTVAALMTILISEMSPVQKEAVN